MTKKKVYSISLNEEVYEKAKKEAEKLHISVSAYLSLLIENKILCTGTSTKQQI